VEFAADALVFADAEDLGDLVGGEAKQSQLPGAFEDFVDVKIPSQGSRGTVAACDGVEAHAHRAASKADR
jgi:hypothetical protein